MQINVTPSTENLIAQLVAAGAFHSPEEVVEQAVALVDLRQRVQQGLRDIDEGRITPHDMEDIKRQVRERSVERASD